MFRNRIVSLCGVIVALGMAGCAPSPLYVHSSGHRGTVGEIPRDGNGEPMWDAIPVPLGQVASPALPPAAGIPITGPGLSEMRPVPAPVYAQPVPVGPVAPIVPEARAMTGAVYPPPPAPGIPITGPGVAEMTAAPAYAAAPVYASPQPGAPRDMLSLSPLAPGTKAEIKQRKRERHRECMHERRC